MNISRIIRVGERLVKQWVKKFCEGGRMVILEHATCPGKAKKTSPHTLAVINWQVKANPKLTARKTLYFLLRYQ